MDTDEIIVIADSDCCELSETDSEDEIGIFELQDVNEETEIYISNSDEDTIDINSELSSVESCELDSSDIEEDATIIIDAKRSKELMKRKNSNLLYKTNKKPKLCHFDNSDNEDDIENEKLSNGTNHSAGYTILTQDDILIYMKGTIDKFHRILQIYPTRVRKLLNSVMWQEDMLFHCLCAGEKREKFLKLFCNPPKNNDNKKKLVNFCEICYVEYPMDELKGLSCDHSCCKGCWREYVKQKVMADGKGELISCPILNCEEFLDDYIFLLCDEDVYARYQQLLARDIVACHSLMRWCPSPGCVFAVKLDSKTAREIKCTCGHVFCFDCGEEWHNPVSCELLKDWKTKCNEDIKTHTWIQINTKRCPKCSTPIQKKGGCNHINCANKSCNADFCWNCLKEYATEICMCGLYFVPAISKIAAKEAKDKYKILSKMYKFCSNKYKYHRKRMEIEKERKARIEDLIQKHSSLSLLNSYDYSYVIDAFDILLHCHQTLMYSYVIRYYLTNDHQNDVFLALLVHLETLTKDLSQILSQKKNVKYFQENNVTIKDKKEFCSNRRNNFVRFCNWVKTEI